MFGSKRGQRIGACALAVASAALVLATAAQSTVPTKPGRPDASTGGVSHVRGTSADLQGIVNPRGLVTTYYFQYGPTVAYGFSTTPAVLPAGELKVKVGQPVTGFEAGYHYRLVASNERGTRFGRDRTFSTKSSRLKFTLSKSVEATLYGQTYVLSGSLGGSANGNRKIILQSNPYPYRGTFTDVGEPILSSANGHFSFTVRRMTISTEFRVRTLDPRPLYSPVVTEHVELRVAVRVRSAGGNSGLVRVFGTVTPAKVGAQVFIQLRKEVKTKKGELTVRYTTEFNTVVKRATRSFSRFSVVVSIRHTGRYRVLVQISKGALVPGATGTVTLHAASGPAAKKKKK